MKLECDECGKQIEARETATAVKECIVESPSKKSKIKLVVMTSCSSGCICTKCRGEIITNFLKGLSAAHV